MPDQPTVIVQQQNRGDGCGCGSVVLLVLVLLPWVMFWDALQGEDSPWWIPIGLVLILIEIAVVVGVADHYLNLRLVERLTKSPQQKQSEQLEEERRRIKNRQSELHSRIRECHRLAEDYDKDGDPEALQQAAVLRAEADLAQIEHNRLDEDLKRLERLRRDLEYKKITDG